ncbi:hypothetical protein SDC9_100859 [bioreactor metagenome]|uniref:Uncharacterized protein n=1 Tax=bioreactor metagenome TaxID=1076179 RepID=A0A645AME4_9ZZZZ
MERLFAQRTHVIDRVAAGGVDFDDVERTFFGNRLAGRALAAGFAVVRMLTVDRFGENPRDGGFADAAGADQQIGVSYPVADDGVAEGSDHMTLPDDVGEGLRTPFAGDDLMFVHGCVPRMVQLVKWRRTRCRLCRDCRNAAPDVSAASTPFPVPRAAWRKSVGGRFRPGRSVR